jgi:D-alanine-D-alanine ligase
VTLVVAVAVLAGGPSVEREVSLQTGAEMIAQLRAGGHRVRPVRVTPENRWCFGRSGDALETVGDDDALPLEDAVLRLRDSGELACIALHGRFGEDGQLQAHLEEAGVRFTGSRSHASSIGMDKLLSKLAATRVGAHCAPHEDFQGHGSIPINRILKSVGLPCVVKPVRGGSSVGVTRVDEEQDLESAVRTAAAEDEQGQVLAEAFIGGTEVTCGVLRREGRLQSLPLIAIRPAGGRLYDYHAKYVAEDTGFECPAHLPDPTAREIEVVSLKLYEALELRGVVRVDFIVRAEDARALFLELNTLPGFTSHSLIPRAAEAAGLTRLEILEAVLEDTR